MCSYDDNVDVHGDSRDEHELSTAFEQYQEEGMQYEYDMDKKQQMTSMRSKRTKTLIISDHPEDPNLCYKWSNGGGGKARYGRQRYVCAGCRRMKDAKQVMDAKLPARIYANGEWLDDGQSHPHFCVPFERDELLRAQERRKIKAERGARGSRKTVVPSAAKVRIDDKRGVVYQQKLERKPATSSLTSPSSMNAALFRDHQIPVEKDDEEGMYMKSMAEFMRHLPPKKRAQFRFKLEELKYHFTEEEE